MDFNGFELFDSFGAWQRSCGLETGLSAEALAACHHAEDARPTGAQVTRLGPHAEAQEALIERLSST